MDWGDSAEQASFRTQVREFVGARLPDFYRDAHANRSGLDGGWQANRASDDAEESGAARDWAKALAEHGWVAPNWPEEYGGAGLSVWEQFIFKQEMAEAGAPAVGGQGVTQIGPTVIVHGNDQQKEKYLTGILEGDTAWCQGYSEPGAGSDLASLQTRARRDGDEYVINGQKIWTSNAHNADNMYILVRTDPDAPKHRGISLILIDDIHEAGRAGAPADRHDLQAPLQRDVLRGRARPAVSNRLGEENRGWYVGMTLLDYERSNIDGAILDRTLVEELIEYIGSDEGAGRTRDTADAARRCGPRSPTATSSARWRATSGSASSRCRPRAWSRTTRPRRAKMFGTETHQRLMRTGTKTLGLYGERLWDKDSAYAPMRSAVHARLRALDPLAPSRAAARRFSATSSPRAGSACRAASKSEDTDTRGTGETVEETSRRHAAARAPGGERAKGGRHGPGLHGAAGTAQERGA